MKPILSLTLALLPLAASAQTPTPTDTAAARSEWGLTASPQLARFFTANRSLPLGLLYKRQLSPTKALRLRLVGQVSYADTANFQDSVTGFTQGYVTGPDRSCWLVQGLAGYEWQRALSRRVGLAYGAEVGIGYERQRTASAFRQAYSVEGLVTTSFETITQDWQMHLRPFLGLYYQPTPRLRLFAESAFTTSYIRRRWAQNSKDTFTKPDEADRFLRERANANRFTARWQAVQLVGATYAF